MIAQAVTTHADIEESRSAGSILSRSEIELAVARIEVRKCQLAIHLKRDDGQESHDATRSSRMVLVPWKKPSRPARQIVLPANTLEQHRSRPMKAERRAVLVRAIGRGRLWLQNIVDGRTTIEDLATEQKCSIRQINMTISLTFLSPALVSAAVEGRFPRGIGVAALRDAPAEWSQQMARLGLAPNTAPKVGHH